MCRPFRAIRLPVFSYAIRSITTQFTIERQPVKFLSLALSELDQIIVNIVDTLTSRFRLPTAIKTGETLLPQMATGFTFAKWVLVF
jgi:hypothetical protein